MDKENETPSIGWVEGLAQQMDVVAAFNSRAWLSKAVVAQGAKITGAGVGCGQADIDIELEGHKFNISIRPI